MGAVAAAGYGTFFKGWAFRTGRMICAIWLIGKVKDVLGPMMYPNKCCLAIMCALLRDF